MSEVSETFYIAGRKKDLTFVVFGSIEDKCMQCQDVVIVDPKMMTLVKDMRGILCVPCVTEKTGKSLGELFTMNQDHIMKILIERFGDATN